MGCNIFVTWLCCHIKAMRSSALPTSVLDTKSPTVFTTNDMLSPFPVTWISSTLPMPVHTGCLTRGLAIHRTGSLEETIYGCWPKNRGKNPKSSHFYRVWNQYKPFILGVFPLFFGNIHISIDKNKVNQNNSPNWKTLKHLETWERTLPNQQFGVTFCDFAMNHRTHILAIPYK